PAGAVELEMAGVSGRSQDQAQQSLEGRGFSPANYAVDTQDEPGKNKDEVIATDPQAGTMANPDDAITIIIDTGNVELPDLTDMDLEEANSVLSDLGLSSQVSEEEDDGPPGVVLRQDPGSGTVPNDTRVALVVSTAPPEPTETPTDDESESPSGDESESPSGEIG